MCQFEYYLCNVPLTLLSLYWQQRIEILRAMIQSAPEHEPRLKEYPSKFLFMKAKLRWDMAKKFIKNDIKETKELKEPDDSNDSDDPEDDETSEGETE